MPCESEDDFAVEVHTQPGPQPASAGKTLRAPLSPGLYETVGINGVDRVELDQEIHWTGPGLLAFDGDREIVLERGQTATLRVSRTGPFVIDPKRTLRAAAVQGLFRDLGHWQDSRGRSGGSCC